jgi:hypothetical protein
VAEIQVRSVGQQQHTLGWDFSESGKAAEDGNPTGREKTKVVKIFLRISESVKKQLK